ncbi:excisionase [Martelella soudanensis]|uniref:excisionase n=1 Tax=unclassified Martelella TaxID=2629616 RepID=UPI001FED5735|nr:MULTISPECIES: excisionase [unclassified Martelella]
MTKIDRSEIEPDTPLRLKVAAKIAFPDGSMTDSGLRSEIAKGRLAVERIAGRQYVTLNAIKEMRALCREERKAHGFISEAAKVVRQSGSSSTDPLRSARDAASMIAEKLKKPSNAILPKSIARNGIAEVRQK